MCLGQTVGGHCDPHSLLHPPLDIDLDVWGLTKPFLPSLLETLYWEGREELRERERGRGETERDRQTDRKTHRHTEADRDSRRQREGKK